jgi:hypothetical protein
MTTCFDRKTAINRTIKSIFKEQQSEHWVGSHVIYNKGKVFPLQARYGAEGG